MVRQVEFAPALDTPAGKEIARSGIGGKPRDKKEAKGDGKENGESKQDGGDSFLSTVCELMLGDK